MSKEAPEVKPFPGVRRVPQSTNWHYWKRNPDTLMSHPALAGKQWAFRGSLGTSNLREANALAAKKLAELESYWETLRASKRVTLPADVIPTLQDAIALRVKAGVLAEDERLRSDPVELAKALRGWWDSQERSLKLVHEIEHGHPRGAGPRFEEDETTVVTDPDPQPYRPRAVPRLLTDDGMSEVAMYVQCGQAEVALYGLLPLLQQRHREASDASRASLGRGGSGAYLVLADAAAMSLGVNLGPTGWSSQEAKPLRSLCHKAYLEALEGLAQRDAGLLIETPVVPDVAQVGASKGDSIGAESVLRLGAVVKSVLAECPENDYKRKMTTVTSLLLQLQDPATPVQDLKQAHITDFLAKVCKLPVDWYTRTQKGESLAKLISVKHPKCIAPKTFESTYRAALGTFLDRAKHEFNDQGFPAGLSVKFATYKGTRADNEEQQRNLKPNELARLFGSDEYSAFAKAPDMAHKYWLPLLALYSGARPRELCQINPQVDYGVEDGIPYFLVSEITDADDGVKKTVKTGDERRFPIHPELVRLGLLVYVDKVKLQGARRLFPGFAVHKGNPAARAVAWFSDFLEEVGLRDETPGALVSGLYVLKKTFITEAARLGLRFQPITGHAELGTSKVLRDSYIIGELPLSDKLAVLEQVRFDVMQGA